MRLDKYLADLKCGTRSQIKEKIRKGAVSVGGVVVRQPDMQVTPGVDEVCYLNKPLVYVDLEYYMFYKPAGCVSATTDRVHQTVMSYIDSVRGDLFPVGRLDIDTEGLMLITNDGPLAHALLSPRRHIPKTYAATVNGRIDDADVQAFREGLDIGEKAVTLPAKLVIRQAGETSAVEVTVCEGKYHQVKRMFEAVGKRVLYLKRIAMGPLKLDEGLSPGEYRPLTEGEREALRAYL